MKQVFFLIIMAFMLGSATVMAQRHHNEIKAKAAAAASTPTTTPDSTAKTVVSSSYSPNYTDSADNDSIDNASSDSYDHTSYNDPDVNDAMSVMKMLGLSGGALAFLVMFGLFILPPLIVLLIIFFIFYYRYKSRKARYRLAEKALEAGKPLPEGIFTRQETQKINQEHAPAYDIELRDRGIKKMFIGAGLFIFFWAITHTFGIACIGLLVFLYGGSQYTTWYIHKQDAEINVKNEEKPADETKKEETPNADTPKEESTATEETVNNYTDETAE